ncbi:MAG: GDSL-type esterase/lipase family protein [Firmicutes bacterium]|nr:GDSL-type esterase/lipase family protein [Bacillota bacterium]
MGRKNKNAGSQVIWMAAILMSLVIAIFSVVYASVTKVGANAPAPGVSAPPSDSALGVSANRDTVSPPASGGAEESLTGSPGNSPTGGPIDSPAADVIPDTPPPSPTPSADYSSVVLAATDDMGDTYVDKFIFFGDSRSNSGLLTGVLVGDHQVWIPQKGYFGLFNQSITRILDPATQQPMAIDDIFAQGKPQYVLISLGTDGIAAISRERFIGDYTALVRRIQAASPRTRIILNSIYPVTQTHSGSDGVTMDRINAANDWIQKVAYDTGTRYLDSASALKDDAGFLKDSYANGDGLSLTKDALTQVLQYLKTHGYPIVQGQTEETASPSA